MKFGYYPYYKELPNEIVFFQTLRQSIETTIDSDLLSVYPNLSGNTVRKLKLLLHAIGGNVPYSPNYTDLKKMIDVKDDRCKRISYNVRKCWAYKTSYER
ncbi:hypothetical protein [Campylobacter ureolyticus]|uniref:hypothetical protein n=1 Tax=Campylobacter ureolyticus TaxID=827 RepID=UPI0004686680|nr:hypothetical protein [Campylobacter ureolyticus]